MTMNMTLIKIMLSFKFLFCWCQYCIQYISMEGENLLIKPPNVCPDPFINGSLSFPFHLHENTKPIRLRFKISGVMKGRHL